MLILEGQKEANIIRNMQSDATSTDGCPLTLLSALTVPTY